MSWSIRVASCIHDTGARNFHSSARTAPCRACGTSWGPYCAQAACACMVVSPCRLALSNSLCLGVCQLEPRDQGIVGLPDDDMTPWREMLLGYYLGRSIYRSL